MIYALPGETKEAVVVGFPTGIAASVRWRLRDNAGGDAIAPTAGAVEDVAGSGVYRIAFTAPATLGQYTLWWSSDGTWTDVAVEDVDVVGTLPSPVPTGGLIADALTTVARARDYLDEQTAPQQLLEVLINGFSESIRDECRRQFKPENAATKTLPFQGGRYLSLAPFELRTLTSMSLLGAGSPTPSTLTLATDFVLKPTQKTRAGTYLWMDLLGVWEPWVGNYAASIVGDWGMASVPESVELACLICVADQYRNPSGAAASRVGEYEITEVVEPATETTRDWHIPRDARGLLRPWRRKRPA